MKKVVLLGWAILIIISCRDVTDIRSDRGKGARRTYNYSKAAVFRAAKEALISLGFALGEINESEGFLSAETPSRGILGFKSGEVVGIWISGNGGVTQLELAWKRRSALDPAAYDWTTQILKSIDEKLNGSVAK